MEEKAIGADKVREDMRARFFELADKDNPQFQYKLALQYRIGGKFEQAREGFEVVAERGHAGACCVLARAYLQGDSNMRIEQDLDKERE